MSPQAWLSLIGGATTLVFVLLWRKEKNAAFAYKASLAPIKRALKECGEARKEDRERHENAIAKARARVGQCSEDMHAAFVAGMESPEKTRVVVNDLFDRVFSVPEDSDDSDNQN